MEAWELMGCGMTCKRGKLIRVPVGYVLSPEEQEKNYVADRVGRCVFSVWIFGPWEVVSPFTRKRGGHRGTKMSV